MEFISNAASHTAGASLVPITAGTDDGMLAWTSIRRPGADSPPSDDLEHLRGLVETGALHSAEAALAMTLPTGRRAAFVAGRIALRAAIHAVSPGSDDVPLLLARPLLRTTRGAPSLPPGVLGSISHKRTQALAIAFTADRGHVGVDLEERPHESDAMRPSIASRILTAREQDSLTSLDAFAHRDATLLRFALKEAIYKAIDPIVERYVRFTEVEVDVHDDGRADVRLLLPEFAEARWRVDAHWHRDDKWIVATARSRE